ncbi:hypothetical protein EON80_13660 [bacterium]|nr:MAG: hypothetical protein EON80_13660 [bacterium]
MSNDKRKREALGRNEACLKAAHAALGGPIAYPNVPSFLEKVCFLNLDVLLKTESDLYVLDSNWKEAWKSKVYALQLDSLVPSPFDDFTAQKRYAALCELASRQDSSSLRWGFEVLKSADASRGDFGAYDQRSRETAIKNLDELFLNGRVSLTIMGMYYARQEQRESVKDLAGEIQKLTPETARAQIDQVYDEAIKVDEKPFLEAKKSAMPEFEEVMARLLAQKVFDIRLRFEFERNLTNRRLFEDAMLLQAIKLETGHYPDTFEAQPDPFGNGFPLTYQRTANGYLLYSIGPDGVDDGGEKPQTLATSPETGAKVISDAVNLDSKGDIVVTNF